MHMIDEQATMALITTLNPRHLQLTLLPTEKCNFRCTYCYEDFTLGKMTTEVQRGIRKFIERRLPNLDCLYFSWFGGEPLTAKRIVLEMSSFARDACLKHGVDFGGAVTTNGYFLDMQTAASLCELKQNKFQVSLDGYGSGHDQSRKLASGAGTFDRIWANLLALRASRLDFSLIIRMHLLPHNLVSSKQLAVALKESFLGDSRFSVLLKVVGNLGGPNRLTVASLTQQEGISVVAEINNILGIVPSSPSSPLSALPTCYAARPNALVIRADGRVQKCTVLLDDDRNTVGRLSPDGNIEFDKRKMHIWMRGYQSMDAKTLRCPAENLPLSKPRKIIPIVAI